MGFGTGLYRLLFRYIWGSNPEEGGPLRRRFIWSLRLLVVMLRELLYGQMSLRASSLVYTTLLSLVPLLAVSFSILKAFGVHYQAAPLIANFLSPLGPEGYDLSVRIVRFVENIDVGVLGSVGLLFLLYTVVSVIQKVEEAFNYVWRIKRSRPLSRQFADYLTVILVGPVLLFTAFGVTASLSSNALVRWVIDFEPLGLLLVLVGRIAPYLFVIVAFTLLYLVVPNTRVRFRSALTGGAAAGLIWQSSGVAFASFVASSGRYSAIYAGFAIVILFMLWLYVSWLIVLAGAQLAYYHQHPQQVRLTRGEFVLSNRLKERLGLAVMYLVTARFVHGGEPWTVDTLVQRLRMPGGAVDYVVNLLLRRGYLGELEEGGLLPERDPAVVTVVEVLDALRSGEEDLFAAEERLWDAPAVEQAMSRRREAADVALEGLTLHALVDSSASIASKE